jgi:hypothetical protein
MQKIDYKNSARNWVKNTFEKIYNTSKHTNSLFELGLSGGVDSRLILSLFLKSNELMDNLKINTRVSKGLDWVRGDQGGIGDFETVKLLSKKYKFIYNQQNEKSELKIKIENTLGYYLLNSIGLYGPMYLIKNYYKFPKNIPMLGVGSCLGDNEWILKKNKDSKVLINDKFINKEEHIKLLENDKTIDFYGISNNSLTYSLNSEIKSGRKNLELSNEKKKYILNAIKKSFNLMKISSDYNFYNALILNRETTWGNYHHNCKIHGSAFIFRPLISVEQCNLYLCNNPFRKSKTKYPSIPQDLIILINSDLACEPYESNYKNLTKSYVSKRLNELGGPIDFTEVKLYDKYGDIKDILNGPSSVFLKIVDEFQWKNNFNDCLGNSPGKQEIKNIIVKIYSNLNEQYQKIYENLYKYAIEICSDKKTPLSSIGNLFTRFSKFLLVD